MKNPFISPIGLKINIFILLTSLYNLTYAQSNCPEGMISYWKFDEVANVSTFIDSFNGFNAYCISFNCPVRDSGIVKWSRNFDSTKISLPDRDLFNWNSNESFSIEFWMKTDYIPSEVNVAIGRNDSLSHLHWWIGYNETGTASFQLKNKDNQGIRIGNKGTVVNDGSWHLISAVRNGSTNKNFLYVDAKLIDSATQVYTASFESTSNIDIGYLNLDSFYYFKGLIDELSLFNIALPRAEIQKHYNNGLLGLDYCAQSTDVSENKTFPNKYLLFQNYPNPFNPTTNIEFQISNSEFVTLKVYDVLGNEIAAIVNEQKPAGYYKEEFNASLYGGNLSSGVYFYKLHAGEYIQNKKMILLR
jgi:hypothetical protein